MREEQRDASETSSKERFVAPSKTQDAWRLTKHTTRILTLCVAALLLMLVAFVTLVGGILALEFAPLLMRTSSLPGMLLMMMCVGVVLAFIWGCIHIALKLFARAREDTHYMASSARYSIEARRRVEQAKAEQGGAISMSSEDEAEVGALSLEEREGSLVSVPEDRDGDQSA